MHLFIKKILWISGKRQYYCFLANNKLKYALNKSSGLVENAGHIRETLCTPLLLPCGPVEKGVSTVLFCPAAKLEAVLPESSEPVEVVFWQQKNWSMLILCSSGKG